MEAVFLFIGIAASKTWGFPGFIVAVLVYFLATFARDEVRFYKEKHREKP